MFSTVPDTISIQQVLAIVLIVVVIDILFNLEIIGNVVPQVYYGCLQWMKRIIAC